MTETILVTGAAGFIGSHTSVELLQNGYQVVGIDDLSNSYARSLDGVEKLAGRGITFYQGDIRDAGLLDSIFAAHRIGAVIHFAAKKAVGESVELPLEYYGINLTGTLSLITAMHRHGVDRLVFSSSCSIYGHADDGPLAESAPARPANPYARSKWMCEQILRDVCGRFPELSVIALRYFNPIGAHESGLLGEDPRGVPNNIVPYLTQVAVGRRPFLKIFGDDYQTTDGSCVRDYIHVVDVADGHRVALGHLEDRKGFRVLNLGTGVGTSVRELVGAFEAASGRRIPVRVEERRAGDVPRLIADAGRVRAEWGWSTRRTLGEMCQDAWRFQQIYPNGYGE